MARHANILPNETRRRRLRPFGATAMCLGLSLALAAPIAARGDEAPSAQNLGHDTEGDPSPSGSTAHECPNPPNFKYFVDESKLPFDALPGLDSFRKYGVLNGAGWRAEFPKDGWNGEIVYWAHGFAGWECELNVDAPPIRSYLIAHGYAWAASSYATNGYAVQQGVDDTMRLSRYLAKRVGTPKRQWLAGASMGGHITGVAIEQNPTAFVGAMPVCGVMGSGKLFDYFLDFNELAQSISGVQTSYPYGVDYVPAVVPQIKAALGGPASPKFLALAAAVQQRTGGTRPGFGIGFGVWLDFLFGLGQPNPGVVPAFPATNLRTRYQLDDDPALSSAEVGLNAGVRRVSRFNFATPDGTIAIPRVNGTMEIPTLTLHTLGDLFVPFSMEQVYARRTAAEDNSELLVQRAIRDVGHCSFSQKELNEGFADLVAWVKTGTRPLGDDVLTPSVVANPSYGCKFTRTTPGVPGPGETAARAAFAPCP